MAIDAINVSDTSKSLRFIWINIEWPNKSVSECENETIDLHLILKKVSHLWNI